MHGQLHPALIRYALLLACLFRALDELVETWKIPPDVAGATFMAAGTSSPELFAAMAGLFFSSESDTGVSTVVGSAVFNILCIIGGSCLVTPSGDIQLPLVSIVRDSTFYLITLLELFLFYRDGMVTLMEALLMTLTYVIYVLVCSYLPLLEDRLAGYTEEEEILMEKEGSALAGLGFDDLEVTDELEAAARDLMDRFKHMKDFSASTSTHSVVHRSTRRQSLSRQSLYSQAPKLMANASVFSNNYDLMLYSRSSLVNSLFGRQDGDDEEEVKVLPPLQLTSDSVGISQMAALEECFNRLPGGESGRVHKHELVRELMRNMGHVSDSEWDKFAKALAFGPAETMTLAEVIPVRAKPLPSTGMDFPCSSSPHFSALQNLVAMQQRVARPTEPFEGRAAAHCEPVRLCTCQGTGVSEGRPASRSHSAS